MHFCMTAGTELPAGETAVGWQLGVYWKEDGLFYRARCAGWDPVSGAHSLLYEDGERESLHLRSEAVKWLQPPPVRFCSLPDPFQRGGPCLLQA